MNLDTDEIFAVPLDEADEYFPRNEAPDGLSADFHTRSGFPRVRAQTIRERHPDYEPSRPLKGLESGLVDEMTHPYVLEALDELRKVQEKIESVPPSDLEQQAKLQTELRTLDAEVRERRERLDEIKARIDDGKTLDAAQLGLLTDRTEEIDPKTEQVRALNGDVLYAETSYALGTMHGDRIGASALWSPVHSQRLFHELPKRLLRETARKLGNRPPEMSVSQHIEKLGVERVMEEDPHFGVDESTDSEKNTDAPRRKGIPSTSL